MVTENQLKAALSGHLIQHVLQSKQPRRSCVHTKPVEIKSGYYRERIINKCGLMKGNSTTFKSQDLN